MVNSLDPVTEADLVAPRAVFIFIRGVLHKMVGYRHLATCSTPRWAQFCQRPYKTSCATRNFHWGLGTSMRLRPFTHYSMGSPVCPELGPPHRLNMHHHGVHLMELRVFSSHGISRSCDMGISIKRISASTVNARRPVRREDDRIAIVTQTATG